MKYSGDVSTPDLISAGSYKAAGFPATVPGLLQKGSCVWLVLVFPDRYMPVQIFGQKVMNNWIHDSFSLGAFISIAYHAVARIPRGYGFFITKKELISFEYLFWPFPFPR